MGLVTIPGGLWIPRTPSAAGYNYNSLLIDASTEKVAFIVRVPKTGTLDTFEFRLGAVTQAPTNGLTCSFQDVSTADGHPDGTQDQLRVVTAGLTANTWVAPGLITSDGTDTGAKRSVTVGDLLACVIEFTSFSASDSLNVTYVSGMSSAGDIVQQQYSDHFSGAPAWAKGLSSTPSIALKYDDGTYPMLPGYPVSALTTTQFNTGSSPDERALYFSLPAACSIGGAWLIYGPGGSGRNADLVLYDSDGTTALETIAIDGDQTVQTSIGVLFLPFSQNRTLVANSNYRLAIKPSSANSVSLREFDVNAAAIMDACEGGQAFHFSSRADAGSWSQTTTKRPFIGLLVTQVHDGTGGGLVQLVNSGALVG